MAYSEYASLIKEKVSSLESFQSSIEKIDFTSIWEGKSSTKQTNNINGLDDAISDELGQLNSLISVLEKIDLYDKAVQSVNNYTRIINNLDKNASDYNANYNQYNNLLISAKELVESYKNQINSLLADMSSNYSSKHTLISSTDVVSTVDVFNKTISEFSKLDGSFDLSKTCKPFFTSVINDDNKNPNFNETDAWIGKNPYAYSNIGQCTWFAWGRFYEIYGYSPGFTTNGNGCVNQLLKAHGDKFVKSSTPIPGAVFSTGLNEQYGHVGIVLDVDEENNKIVIQDGNYNGQSDTFAVAQKDWGTRTLSLSDFLSARGGPVFANPIGREAVMNG